MENIEIENIVKSFADVKTLNDEISLVSQYAQIDVLTAEKAESELKKTGVNATGDNAIIIHAAAREMTRADKSLTKCSIMLGLIGKWKLWEKTLDPNDKPYGKKGKERYLKDVFPGYSVKTLLTYVKTGEYIFLPALENPNDLRLKTLSEMTLPLASRALPLLESKEGTENLDKAIAKGEKLTARKLSELKPRETSKPKNNVKNVDAQDFKLISTDKKLASVTTICEEDGDCGLTIYANNFSEFLEILNNAKKSPDDATAIVKFMYDGFKKLEPKVKKALKN